MCVLLCISPIRLENLRPRLLPFFRFSLFFFFFFLLLFLFTALISVSPAVRQIFCRKKNTQVESRSQREERTKEDGKEFLEQFRFAFNLQVAAFCICICICICTIYFVPVYFLAASVCVCVCVFSSIYRSCLASSLFSCLLFTKHAAFSDILILLSCV